MSVTIGILFSLGIVFPRQPDVSDGWRNIPNGNTPFWKMTSQLCYLAALLRRQCRRHLRRSAHFRNTVRAWRGLRARPSRHCRTGEARGRGKFVCLLGALGDLFNFQIIWKFPQIIAYCLLRIGEISRAMETHERARTDLLPTGGHQFKLATLKAAGILGIGATRWQTARQSRSAARRRVFHRAPKPGADRPQAR